MGFVFDVESREKLVKVERVIFLDLLVEVENRLKGVEQVWLVMEVVQVRVDGRLGQEGQGNREMQRREWTLELCGGKLLGFGGRLYLGMIKDDGVKFMRQKQV